jgi:hypothetical protein
LQRKLASRADGVQDIDKFVLVVFRAPREQSGWSNGPHHVFEAFKVAGGERVVFGDECAQGEQSVGSAGGVAVDVSDLGEKALACIRQINGWVDVGEKLVEV